MTISTQISGTLFDGEGYDAYLEDIIQRASESIQAKEALDVADAAIKYRYLNNAPAYTGPWTHEKTPYLVEPMRDMTDRLYETVVFMGPAQCGKTELFLNYLVYTVMCDPADLMLVQTVQATARDFSITRVDRMHRHSEVVGKKVLVDNTYDKQYSSGMILRLSWPTVNELSGKPVPRVFLTDYDRMTMDVDGEGTPYVLAKARTTSFKKYGKVIVESSPGFVQLDPTWQPATPHQAPPCEGIASLYNSGNRRRWYWQCYQCKFGFEPHWNLLSYPNTKDIEDAAAQAVMYCPRCRAKYSHDYADWCPSKEEMNATRANWLKEGQNWTEDGIHGKGVRSANSTYWLQGVSATFNSWANLVKDVLNAEKEFEETGKEETLKGVINTKVGMPYLPKAQAKARLADDLKKRAFNFGHKVVPHGARFLIATIDVQGNRFEVQVQAVGTEDIWVIDRYQIKYSKRVDPTNVSQYLPIDPASYPEDWRHILYEVLQKTYPLQDDETRHMGIYYTMSDSAGKDGFTTNAYEFYRWLARGYDPEDRTVSEEMKERYPWSPGYLERFGLLKGEAKPGTPRLRITYPDSQRKDRHAGALGEIPVSILNTTILKNQLDGILGRQEEGGRINFPDWLPLSFYKELVVETKAKDGKWENLTGHRNESWDLLVYCLAALLHPTVHWGHIRWAEPEGWADEWDRNTNVFSIAENDAPPSIAASDLMADLEALGRSMNN